MTIRAYRPTDHDEWLRLRSALWPDTGAEALAAEMAAWLSRRDVAVFVAEREKGGLCGFAEVGERPNADGCGSGPVAYLEGWYVDPDRRGRGVGAALVRALEGWARTRGYLELASDALLDNTAGQRAHERAGFREVERAVLYRKDL